MKNVLTDLHISFPKMKISFTTARKRGKNETCHLMENSDCDCMILLCSGIRVV